MSVTSNYFTGKDGSVVLPDGMSGDVEEFSYSLGRAQEKTNILGTAWGNRQTVEYEYSGTFMFMIPTTGGNSGVGLADSLDDVQLTLISDSTASGTLTIYANISEISVVSKASAATKYTAKFESKGAPIVS